MCVDGEESSRLVWFSLVEAREFVHAGSLPLKRQERWLVCCFRLVMVGDAV